MKRSGIFVKVFIYTIIFSALLVGATAALFWQQFQTYYSHYQIQEVVNSYQQLAGPPPEKDGITITASAGRIYSAGRFYERNESFQFYITDKGGQIVYKTPGADMSGIAIGLPPPNGNPPSIMINLDDGYKLHALRSDVFSVDYGKWVLRAIFLTAAMIAVCVVGAFLFARGMTKPIKALADTANRMANLEEIPPLPKRPERKDELGALARDVYSMYDKLKESISELEGEILREREIEETQRYFFSAASHELKTPIAAASVLLEGMLANIGDYKDHPKYLRECVKLMDAQSKTISEILEIVGLSDGKIVPVPESLDIRHIVCGLLPNFQTLAEAKGQRIAVDIPSGQICLADSKMLQKALSNVILNAVQNTPKGGGIRIWSEPADEQDKQVRLCVQNTGAKIDETVLPKLFDPFYRADKARNQKSGRSGLGLTIVRKTLESMNAPFALENTPDGVLFWMELPRA